MLTVYNFQAPRFLELLLSAKLQREQILILGEARHELLDVIESLLPFGATVGTRDVVPGPYEPYGYRGRLWDLIICIGPRNVLAPEELADYLSDWEGTILAPNGRIVVEIPLLQAGPARTLYGHQEYLDAADHAGCTITEINGIPCTAPVQERDRFLYLRSVWAFRDLWRLRIRVDFPHLFGQWADLQRTTGLAYDAHLPPQDLEALLTGNHTRLHAFATFRRL
ncbi:MAG: hypothetical protein LQ349_001115 [Xanthoria aureola]|nr:MAG: hypothetical protein LQ349_001115 [Xanthoria aureola]